MIHFAAIFLVTTLMRLVPALHSQGYAGLMSTLLRKEIEAIWHVGIGVYNKEYWFSTRIESKDLR